MPFLACLLVSGCVEAPEKQHEQRLELIASANAALAAREPCCTGFENAAVHGAWPNSLTHVVVGENSDVAVFGEDKVYFAGLELPANMPSRSLLIKEWYVVRARDPHAPATILSSRPGVGSAYVLKPHIAFLDARHKLINEVVAPVCFDQGWDGERTGFFSAATAPLEARFAIVFTRPVDSDAGINHKYSGGGGTVGFSFQYSGTMKVFFGPTGNLELGLVNAKQIESLRASPDKECSDVLAAWGYQP